MSSRDQASAGLGKLGVEIELLAPRGRSRQDFACAIAEHYGAAVRRFFHPQGEPSKAPNTAFFQNLTLGFVVEDTRGNVPGNVLAQCVDDLTLQDDLDRGYPPRPGWYRIVSDDPRLLRLTMRHADAVAPLETVLRPIARMFGTVVEEGEAGMRRVADQAGSPIAIGATLPGERERPCELITPPIETKHLDRLETLLGLARSLGFSVPAEGAIHLHFDAAPLCAASTIANLVRFLGIHSDALKQRFGTNPRCRRLGTWPTELFELVASPAFLSLEWAEARKQLSQFILTKYCDFNLRNLIHPVPDKHTFEVRILPVWTDGQRIVDAAAIFARILHWARDGAGQLKSVPPLEDFIGRAPLQKRHQPPSPHRRQSAEPTPSASRQFPNSSCLR